MTDKTKMVSRYVLNEIYPFKVKAPYSNYCELIDEETGITTYLQNTQKIKLRKGQVLQCRIIKHTEKHPKIELVDYSSYTHDETKLTDEKLLGLLAENEVSFGAKDFAVLLLTDEVNVNFEKHCQNWIQSLVAKKLDLYMVRKEVSHLLEMSGFLDLCDASEWDDYQERLTYIIEQLGYTIRANELIAYEENPEAEENSHTFIQNLLEKLRVSGFVYHPNKNFNILSCLYLRSPQLMNSSITELLDIICDRERENWKKEPFRSAFVQLLELFIQESEGKVDKVKNGKELVDNLVKALGIQLLLLRDNKNTESIDYSLNCTRLCVALSYLSTNTRKCVDFALYHLLGADANLMTYTQKDLRNGVLPHFLNNLVPGHIDTTNTFTRNKVELKISNEGIRLLTVKSGQELYPVIPAELALWNGLQVYLDEKYTLAHSAAGWNDIAPYVKMWEHIDFRVFNSPQSSTVVANGKKKRHRVYDLVNITFIRQDATDKNKYYCQIEDEIGGEGFIYIKDIVPYVVSSTALRHFYAADGSRYVFQAQIIENEDGYFHFSMIEQVKAAISMIDFSDEEVIVCSLGKDTTDNSSGGVVPAISSQGMSVEIRNAHEFPGLCRYETVNCRYKSEGYNTFHIRCEIVEPTYYEFNLDSAFRSLMEAIAVDCIAEKMAEQEDDLFNIDKILDEGDVRQLVFMIDRLASVDDDYVKSYNYLGYARLLCMLIGWESQAAYYKGRMDIISMLHYFAINGRIDEVELQHLENVNAELFSSNVLLRERLAQLQTISMLGKPECNDQLYLKSKENEGVRHLAQLVLAYNITKSSEMESAARDIYNRVIRQLNLNGYETGLKMYGTGVENEEVEYKESTLYAPKEGLKPEKQMNEILAVINSFMNTNGGTLYVGVNNSGLGVGLEEDLQTEPFFGDKDKYKNRIINEVAKKWQNVGTTYIEHIDYDAENAEKDVLIIKIKPCRQGMPLDGWWWYRVGGTKRRLSEAEYNSYNAERRGLSDAESTVELEEPVLVLPLPEVEPVAAQEEAVVITLGKDEPIRTSRIRHNVLAEYEDPEHYVEPVGFFKFLSGNKFSKIDSYDYDYESLLTLAVKEEEEKGYLVLGYENGCIVKIAVEELLNFYNREYSRYDESRLLFASIAGENDAVLTICRDNKRMEKVMMRVDSLSMFDVERLMSKGRSCCNDNLFSEILAYEIIPEAELERFEPIMDKPKTIVGYAATEHNSSMVRKLHEWGVDEI